MTTQPLTIADYWAALRAFEALDLLGPKSDTPEGRRLDELAHAIVLFERDNDLIPRSGAEGAWGSGGEG